MEHDENDGKPEDNTNLEGVDEEYLKNYEDEELDESLQVKANMVGIFYVLTKSKVFSQEIWELFKGRCSSRQNFKAFK